MKKAEGQPATGGQFVTMPPDRNAGQSPWRRHGGWLFAGVGFLAVIAVVLAMTASGERRSATPSASLETPSSPSPARSATFDDSRWDRLARLRDAASAALQRVAPGTLLGIGADSIGNGRQLVSYRVGGRVEVDGRRGELRVMAARGPLELTCAGYGACQMTTGPQGEKIRMVQFEREVPAGQPRDLEIGAMVWRPSGSWVEVSVNNADAPFSPDQTQSPRRTGQVPPLTPAQVAALAVDPALDVCATACEIQ